MDNPCLLMRPANVLAKLPKGSKALVVGVREFLNLPEHVQKPLLFVPVIEEASIAGVLFAAREARAPIGFSIPFRPGERSPTDWVFEEVIKETERTQHEHPVLIQGGPFRVGHGLTHAQLGKSIFKFIDGGATLVSIDASRLPPSEQADAYLRILDEVGTLDYGLEVSVPLDDRQTPSAAGLEHVLTELKLHQITPSFIRVSSWQLVPPEDESGGVDFSILEELRRTCLQFDAKISIEEVNPRGSATAHLWSRAGVRKIDAVGAFSEVLFKQLDSDERTLWLRRGWPLGMSGVEWLALRPDVWADWPSELQNQIEAISYAETAAWADTLDFRHCSSALVDYWLSLSFS